VLTRPSPPLTLARRARAEWHTARRQWGGISRWVLARRFVLPVIVGWAMISESGGQPWRAAEAVVVVLALLARFVWPATALLVTAALADSATALVVAVPVLAYRAGRRITAPGWVVGAVFGVAAALAGLDVLARVAAGHAHGARYWGLASAGAAGYVSVGLLLPGAIGFLAAERARRVDALRERNAILERADRLVDEQARAQERARIAGEMHDLLGHRLSLISLHAGALELGARERAPAFSEQASTVRRMTKMAMDELREVLSILRLDVPEGDIGVSDNEVGTRADVSALVLASQRAGQQIRLEWEGEDLPGVDGNIRRAVHRVVREALTNVHKHAPGAATAVLVGRGADGIRVEVRNELRAPVAAGADGTGLAGLRERVRLVGGTIQAGATSDRAFRVVAVFPLARGLAHSSTPDGRPDPDSGGAR